MDVRADDEVVEVEGWGGVNILRRCCKRVDKGPFTLSPLYGNLYRGLLLLYICFLWRLAYLEVLRNADSYLEDEEKGREF